MRKHLIALLVITPLLLSSHIQTSSATDSYTENFCKNIEFSSKVSKKKCQDVVFTENKAQVVKLNGAQRAIVKEEDIVAVLED